MVCLENAKYRGTLGRMRGVGGGLGGVQAVFVAKIKKYQGTFCRWVGTCYENSFFQKVPSKKG